MEQIDRRSLLTGIICSAAVATVGLTILPKAAKIPAIGCNKGWCCKV